MTHDLPHPQETHLPPQQLKACGVLVVRGAPIHSFLLMVHANRWDLPKGHVEPGETEWACALRELQEETGIAPEDLRVHPSFRFTTQYMVRSKRSGYEPWNKTVVIFLATLLRDVKIRPSEHLGHRWVPWNPPHQIQAQTIDPLLASVDAYLQRRPATE